MTTERKLTILHNAYTLLVDETIEQYDDLMEWKNMMCNELDCTIEELAELGLMV